MADTALMSDDELKAHAEATRAHTSAINDAGIAAIDRAERDGLAGEELAELARRLRADLAYRAALWDQLEAEWAARGWTRG
jgi:hypothetical protein